MLAGFGLFKIVLVGLFVFLATFFSPPMEERADGVQLVMWRGKEIERSESKLALWGNRFACFGFQTTGRGFEGGLDGCCACSLGF